MKKKTIKKCISFCDAFMDDEKGCIYCPRYNNVCINDKGHVLNESGTVFTNKINIYAINEHIEFVKKWWKNH